mmetsp:Transcript_33767/g.95542  ORF Transcript_33767/g.95542 Transcript_33767/m.95542 type:complete len:209 (+) Transcript_33767:274-900(+)
MEAVVDVGGPHSRGEEQQLVGEGVEGHQKQHHHVGGRLEHAIDGVEGQPGKGRQRVLFVVLVMGAVEVLVERAVVQGAVHPVHPQLHSRNIHNELRSKYRHTVLSHPGVCLCPALLHHPFREGRQHGVQGQSHHGDLDLLKHVSYGWHLVTKQVLSKDAVDVVCPHGSQAEVDYHGEDKVPQPRLDVRWEGGGAGWQYQTVLPLVLLP